MELEVADNGTKKKTFYVVNKAQEPGSTKNTILNFLYNKETGAICGRTLMSWLKITVFYIIFYICLALFALAMFSLFWELTISKEKPRWIGADGLIGSTPGVGFRPMPDQDDNAESTLIWINMEKDAEESFWATRLDEYFAKYYPDSNNGKKCNYNGDSADSEQGCDVDINSFTECKNGSGYGYTESRGSPCVLVKLNRIYGWKPEKYTAEKLPKDMPLILQEKIKALAGSSAPELDTTWITCQPENPVDRENVGPIEYYSLGSGSSEEFGMIPNYFYPYEKQAGYESPFVFIRFIKPVKNVLIQVECRAWARNIGYNRQFRVGSVHFELMID